MKTELKPFVILNETLETGLELKKFFIEELGLCNRQSPRFTSHKSDPECSLYYYGVKGLCDDVDNFSEIQVSRYKLPILTLEEAREMYLGTSSSPSYDIY